MGVCRVGWSGGQWHTGGAQRWGAALGVMSITYMKITSHPVYTHRHHDDDDDYDYDDARHAMF